MTEERTLVTALPSELPAVGEDPRALGAILRRQTRLTASQLAEALDEQQAQRREDPLKDGLRIGEILVRMHHVTEEEVLAALGTQLGLSMAADLKPEEVDAELVAKVPINFAKAHRLLPIRRAGVAVLTAVADPLDVAALDDVRRALGCDVEPLLVPSGKVIEAINKVYARQSGDTELGEKGDDEMGGEAE